VFSRSARHIHFNIPNTHTLGVSRHTCVCSSPMHTTSLCRARSFLVPILWPKFGLKRIINVAHTHKYKKKKKAHAHTQRRMHTHVSSRKLLGADGCCVRVCARLRARVKEMGWAWDDIQMMCC